MNPDAPRRGFLGLAVLVTSTMARRNLTELVRSQIPLPR